jgi:hypothetical protein
MHPKRRQELELRRSALQERLRQREAAESLALFTAPLDQVGVRYALIASVEARSWVRDRFPVTRWGRIDWSRVSGCMCASDEQLTSPSEWLAGLESRAALGDVYVTVFFADASRPTLRLLFRDLIEHVDLVVDCSWDTWIFNQNDDWIIERYHHGEWCWGRAPSPLQYPPALAGIHAVTD